MIDYKDKLILESLTQNCRVATSQLSKITRLSQPSVVYRIKRLEDNGYISKYDAIINHKKFPYYKDIIFLSIPEDKREKFEMWTINNKHICWNIRLIDKMNYVLYVFSRNQEEREELYKYIESNSYEYKSYAFEDILFDNFTLFGMNLNVKKPRIEKDKNLKLDEADIKLIKHLTDGGGRDPILDIANKIGIHYETLLYKFKRLTKANYFPLFLAQPSTKRFSTQIDILLIKSDMSFEEVFKKLKGLKEISYLIKLSGNYYYSQIISNDFREYKDCIEKINIRFRGLGEVKIYNTKDWVFINRYPFEWLLE